jgi:LuxR family maltose regulon positive regulatory protein
VAGNGHGAFAARVAAARAAVVADPAVLFSDRELHILALLPSLLDRPGHRRGADRLGNTIKSHVRVIYTKLGVSSRSDAVARARSRAAALTAEGRGGRG